VFLFLILSNIGDQHHQWSGSTGLFSQRLRKVSLRSDSQSGATCLELHEHSGEPGYYSPGVNIIIDCFLFCLFLLFLFLRLGQLGFKWNDFNRNIEVRIEARLRKLPDTKNNIKSFFNLLEGLYLLDYDWWQRGEITVSVLDSVITYFPHRKVEDRFTRAKLRHHFEKMGINLGELPRTVRETLTAGSDNPINPTPFVADLEAKIDEIVALQRSGAI
jgi:hypothetical protein